MRRRNGMTVEDCSRFLERAKTLRRPRQLLEHFASRMREMEQAEAQGRGGGDNLMMTTVPLQGDVAGGGGTDPLLMFCTQCASNGPEGTARGFFASPPEQIVMCANRLHDESEIEETLVHELVHAVDYCTRGIDLAVCEDLACSEVRAAREAECSESTYLRAFPIPDVARNYLHKRCTRLHATSATRAMFPARAESCIEAAFDRCFNDHVPFREGTYAGEYRNQDISTGATEVGSSELKEE